jgi:chromate reductase, NAD(P)H dehydrogenase (quinone)
MITIISGTNRPGSNTRKVAEHYRLVLAEKGQNTVFLSLEDLTSLSRDGQFNRIEAEILIPTKKFLMIMPEYNGSFPGVLKLMIDLSEVKKVWGGKKALLAGVANGRAGNLRGMDQLTGILNHMNTQVLPNKVPLSMVNKMLNEEGKLTDAGTMAVIEKQIDDFLQF